MKQERTRLTGGEPWIAMGIYWPVFVCGHELASRYAKSAYQNISEYLYFAILVGLAIACLAVVSRAPRYIVYLGLIGWVTVPMTMLVMFLR